MVSDAAIATKRLGDGKLLPVLILDTSNRPDIEELIRVHQFLRPGDVVSQWATIADGRMGLVLNFQRPAEVSFTIVFDMPLRAGLIDQIMRMKGIYLQAGKHGDRLRNTLDAPKITVEIPDTGFSKEWDGVFLRAAIAQMRELGLTRREAKAVAPLYVKHWREFGDLRIDEFLSSAKQ